MAKRGLNSNDITDNKRLKTGYISYKDLKGEVAHIYNIIEGKEIDMSDRNKSILADKLISQSDINDLNFPIEHEPGKIDTLLGLSIIKGKLNIAQSLIFSGVNLDDFCMFKNENMPVLFACVTSRKKITTLRLMLENGADVNINDSKGNILNYMLRKLPSSDFLQKDFLDILGILLEYDLNPYVRNKIGYTALHTLNLRIENAKPNVPKYLIKIKNKFEAMNITSPVLDSEEIVPKYQTDHPGNYRKMTAESKKSYKLIKLQDPEPSDHELKKESTKNQDILNILLIQAMEAPNIQEIELLLKQPGVNPNLKMNCKFGGEDEILMPILHYAFYKQNADLINLLLRYGADLNQSDGNCLTLADIVFINAKTLNSTLTAYDPSINYAEMAKFYHNFIEIFSLSSMSGTPAGFKLSKSAYSPGDDIILVTPPSLPPYEALKIDLQILGSHSEAP